MGKIFYLMGKSASGKDTIYQKLMQDKELNLHPIILYTTRPIRDGEKEGVDYHFISEEQVKKLGESGHIIEMRTYDTVYGPWRYLTVDDGQIDLNHQNYIVIGTLESFLKVREYFQEEQVIPIYVYLDDGKRLEWALEREKKQRVPRYSEMCRRFLADEKDFSTENLIRCGLIHMEAVEKYAAENGGCRERKDPEYSENSFFNQDSEECTARIKKFIQSFPS